MTKEITADLLVEDVAVREQYMNRVDVLYKVKKLLLLPELDMATTKMVAEFYGIPLSSMNRVYVGHRQEFLSDGLVSYKSTEVKELKGELGERVSLDKVGLGKYVSSVNLYPRRAILRVGMLLRDSEVAKEVRIQLLNIEEKATAEVKVADITEEGMLLLAMFKADTPEEKSAATKEYDAFKNRYVEKVEAKLAEAETEKECHSLKMFSNFSYEERVNILGGENYGRN